MSTENSETTVEFIVKNVNNVPYEWGRNCATLEYDENRTRKILEDYNGFSNKEDEDQFWEGYNDGPREDHTVISLPSHDG